MQINELLAPSTILTFEEGDCPNNIEVIVPAYVYVPPELIALFITNQGGFTPKYIYRSISEFYSKEDKYDYVNEAGNDRTGLDQKIMYANR